MLCLAFTSCKKDDFRDDYVGTYFGKESWVNDGVSYSRDLTVDVTKSSVSDQKMILKAKFYTDATEVVDVEVGKDGTFSTSFATRIGSITETIFVSGGKFSGNSLKYSYSAQNFVTCTADVTKR